MKKLYESYKSKFVAAKEIAQKYGLPVEKLDEAISEISDFHLTVPVVGAFSTGKSSLINAVLGQEILATDITAETAVPAEICYGDNCITYFRNDNGSSYTGSVEDFNTQKLSFKEFSHVQVTLDNEFLSQIPSVKIVDMPGFDSGYEVHDKAIKDYLPKSLAYVIAAAEDDGTLHDSVLRFLDDLKISNMPVYLVITKADDKDSIDDVKNELKKLMSTRMGLDDIKVAVTEASTDEVDEFKAILLELQNDSDAIFEKHYTAKLNEQLQLIHTYLLQQLKAKNMEPEKLEEERKYFENKINEIQNSLEKEKADFHSQAESCIADIQQKVENELKGKKASLVNMLAQGSDISNRINNIVRNTISTEINENFGAKLKRYTDNVTQMMQIDTSFDNVDLSLLSKEDIEENESIKKTLKEAITPLTTTILGSLGGMLSSGGLAALLGGSAATAGTAAATGVAAAASGAGAGAALGPIGIICGAAIGVIAGQILNKGMKSKEYAQKREAAEQKVNQIIDEVCDKVKHQIREQINSMINAVDNQIEASMSEQIAVQRKALDDLQARISSSAQEREKNEAMIRNDLEIVNSMIKNKEFENV